MKTNKDKDSVDEEWEDFDWILAHIRYLDYGEEKFGEMKRNLHYQLDKHIALERERVIEEVVDLFKHRYNGFAGTLGFSLNQINDIIQKLKQPHKIPCEICEKVGKDKCPAYRFYEK